MEEGDEMVLDRAVSRKPRGALRAVLLAMVLAFVVGGETPPSQAAPESPYRVSEFPVRVAAGLQSNPAISGKWVIWQEQPDDGRRIAGRNLDTGLDFVITAPNLVQGAVSISGDTLVAMEWNGGSEYGIFGYKLPDGQRFTIAPFKGGAEFTRRSPRADGKTVVWVEGPLATPGILGYDLGAQRPITVSTYSSLKESPTVSGNFVVWLDRRNSPPGSIAQDIYGYDLSTGQEFRLTAQPEWVSAVALSGSIVVWPTQRDGVGYLKGYDVARKQEFPIAQVPWFSSGPDIDGDLVVWGGQGEYDDDVFGYDLKQGKQFIISRAIGQQGHPRISGKTVVWVDHRNGGIGKYEFDSDIYGVRLEPGPGPVPPVVGAPGAADAKIEIVWPHGGVPVTEADKANIGAWLFLSDTLKLAPCQWNPKVQLWKAVNNTPAKLVAVSTGKVGRYYGSGPAVPSREFNDVAVGAARDPNSKIYFFATVDGVPGRTNVWAHAADARTYYPQRDVPAGVLPVGGAVDAKIQIVWPHDDVPVAQAKKVNISASVFTTGTLQSVPPDWNPSVRLYRALNNDVSREVAVGQKRLVQATGFTYPVWDFNDVEVGAATDPVNKYYFTLSVDGVATSTNVWSHGADARTYFPQVDTPAQSCQGG